MKNSKHIKRALSVGLLGALALNLCTTAMPVSAAKKTKEAKASTEVDLNGAYHARLGIQTSDSSWITRLAYFDKGINDDYQKETDNQLQGKDPSAAGQIFDGTFTDTEIAGNGTYTVSLADADFGGENTISQLHIATDIPVNDTIQFSDVSVKIDDQDVVTFEQGYLEDEEVYLAGGMDVLLFNHWRDELITTLEGLGKSETGENGWKLLQGTGGESIQVTFTVSGFAYDNPDAVGATEETPAAEDVNANAATSENTETKETKGMPVVLVAVVAVVVLGAAVAFVSKKKKK